MTSKTELKELIELLRTEVRELKTEIEVMKTLIVNNNQNVVYPFIGTTKPWKFTYSPYVQPDTHTISDTVTCKPEGSKNIRGYNDRN